MSKLYNQDNKKKERISTQASIGFSHDYNVPMDEPKQVYTQERLAWLNFINIIMLERANESFPIHFLMGAMSIEQNPRSIELGHPELNDHPVSIEYVPMLFAHNADLIGHDMSAIISNHARAEMLKREMIK